MIFPPLTNDHTPVQLLDGDSFNVIFSSAHPLRVSVLDEKRVTKFQVEDGGERSDHIVDNGVEITIEFVLSGMDAKQQFQSMRQAYQDNRMLTIQCRMGTYESMLIEAFPHEETPAIYDGAVLPIRFVEWREVTPEYGELQEQRLAPEQVTNSSQSSTVDRGTQTGQPAPENSEAERRGSTLSRWGLI